jgi:hypothetical protein
MSLFDTNNTDKLSDYLDICGLIKKLHTDIYDNGDYKPDYLKYIYNLLHIKCPNKNCIISNFWYNPKTDICADITRLKTRFYSYLEEINNLYIQEKYLEGHIYLTFEIMPFENVDIRAFKLDYAVLHFSAKGNYSFTPMPGYPIHFVNEHTMAVFEINDEIYNKLNNQFKYLSQ